MKKLSLLTIFCLTSLTFFAQEVMEVQQVLLTKRTATWCPFCGTWGWTFFEDLIEDNEDKAVLMAAHFGGSMLENQTSLDIVSNFGSAGQPRFFLNNELISVTSGSIASARTTVKNAVDLAYTNAPIANTGIEAAASGGELTLATKTRFFQAAEGAYYLGVYLVENDVFAYQAGIDAEVDHAKILRASLTGSTFGEPLASGTITAGTEIDLSFSGSMDGYDIENLEVVTVIWRLEGSTYQVVNTWETDEIETTPTSLQEAVVPPFTATLFPTISQDHATLALEVKSSQSLEIALYDQEGRRIQPIFDGQLSAGIHQIQLDTHLPKISGTYYIVIRDGKHLVSRPLLIQ